MMMDYKTYKYTIIISAWYIATDIDCGSEILITFDCRFDRHVTNFNNDRKDSGGKV